MALPDGVELDPAVRTVLETALSRDDISWVQIHADAELGHDTIRMWAYGRGSGAGPGGSGPGIRLVRRALRALGMDLAVVPWQEEPDELPIERAPVLTASGRSYG